MTAVAYHQNWSALLGYGRYAIKNTLLLLVLYQHYLAISPLKGFPVAAKLSPKTIGATSSPKTLINRTSYVTLFSRRFTMSNA